MIKDALLTILKNEGAAAMLKAAIAMYRKGTGEDADRTIWDLAIRGHAQKFRNDMQNNKVQVPDEKPIKWGGL